MKLHRIFALVLMLVTQGCMPKQATLADMPGRYQLLLPQGAVETLELLAGGECIQEIRLKDGQTYTARGKWRCDENFKNLYLEGTRTALTPDLKLNPSMNPIPAGNTRGLTIARTLSGTLTLGLGEDWAYKRLP